MPTAVGEKNKYGYVWDGQQWNDPADQFLESVTPRTPTPPAPAADDDGSFKFQPGESTGHAMLRYGGNELKGFAKAFNPVDVVKGFLHLPGMAVKGLTEDIPALIRDPSLLYEAPAAATDFALHPESVGTALGTVVAGKAAGLAAPYAADAALAGTRGALGAAGRVADVVGRGAEAAGSSSALRHGGRYGAGGLAIAGHPLEAAAAIAAPPLLRATGRGLQSLGGALGEASEADALASRAGAAEALRNLRGRLTPGVEPTHAELLEAADEKFFRERRAMDAQDAAYRNARARARGAPKQADVVNEQGIPYTEGEIVEPPAPPAQGALPGRNPARLGPGQYTGAETLPPTGALPPGPPPRLALPAPRVFTGPDTLPQRLALPEGRLFTGPATLEEELAREAAARGEGPRFGAATFEDSLPEVPDITYEATSHPPAAPGFEVGDQAPFTYQGTANANAPGPAAPGFEIGRPLDPSQVPVSRAKLLENLRARTRGAPPPTDIAQGSLSPDLAQSFVDEARAGEPPPLTAAERTQLLARAKGLRRGDMWPTMQQEMLDASLTDPSLMPAAAPVSDIAQQLLESLKERTGTEAPSTKKPRGRGPGGRGAKKPWKPYQGPKSREE